MKCPACGNEIADDVKNCPLCGKHIPVNLSKAGEQPASGQDAPRTDIAGGTLCPRCQTPLRPGAAFCGNCGASAAGGGTAPENPYVNAGRNFGNAGTGGNMEALGLMKDMNNMMYWIIGYLVVSFIPYVNVLSIFVYIYILVQTPALADRCGKLLGDDHEVSGIIAKTRSRVIALWILMALTFVVIVVMVVAIVILAVSMESGRGDASPVLIIAALFFLILTAGVLITNLVYQILAVIGFVKVKDAVDRKARDY